MCDMRRATDITQLQKALKKRNLKQPFAGYVVAIQKEQFQWGTVTNKVRNAHEDFVAFYIVAYEDLQKGARVTCCMKWSQIIYKYL